MGVRESLLNTITSVADSDFVRIVTSAGASSKATVRNLFKGFESNLSAKSSLTTSDYIRVVGSDNEAYKQGVSSVMTTMGVDKMVNGVNNPSGSTLGALKESGFYTISSAANYSDSPTTTYGFLAVYNGGTYRIQSYYAPSITTEYVRYSTNSGSSWSAWTETPSYNTTDVTDLNNAVGNGRIYRFDTGTSNTPPSFNYGYVFVMADGNNVRQICINRGGADEGIIYRRGRSAQGVWGSWVKEPTRAEMDVQAVTFTPNSGFTSNLSIRKVGKVVMVNGYITATNAFGSSETIVGNIPAGSRPGDAIRAVAGVATQAYLPGDVAYVAIGIGGDLGITAKSGNTYKRAYFSISYAAQN